MILQRTSAAAEIPTDIFGNEYPEAVVKDFGISFDFTNEILTLNWAMYRNMQDVLNGGIAFKTGLYEWLKEPKDAVYEIITPAVYSEEVPEVLDSKGKVKTPAIPPQLITEAVKELISPKFGAFKDITNITVTTSGSDFGTLGEQWLLSHKCWKGWEIVS